MKLKLNRINSCLMGILIFLNTQSIYPKPSLMEGVVLNDTIQEALFYNASGTIEGQKKAFELANRSFTHESDPIAARLLANFYYMGKIIEVDKNAALDYFLIASEVDSESAYKAALMLLNGDGVEPDIVMGAQLMRQAADMGNDKAQFEMASTSLAQSKLEENQKIKESLEKNSLYYSKLCFESNVECQKVFTTLVQNGKAGLKILSDTSN
ncbi:tetratricopeptide repeat protein [Acinetobacter baumannii]